MSDGETVRIERPGKPGRIIAFLSSRAAGCVSAFLLFCLLGFSAMVATAHALHVAGPVYPKVGTWGCYLNGLSFPAAYLGYLLSRGRSKSALRVLLSLAVAVAIYVGVTVVAGKMVSYAKGLTWTKYGLGIEKISDDMAQRMGYKSTPTGLAVTAAMQGSPADHAGLKRHMVITEAQGKKVASPKEFDEILNADDARDGVELLVIKPNGEARRISMKPKPGP